ncbi:MAG: GTP 3',8-cyclase MoaA [Velocimicrobium sp.]
MKDQYGRKIDYLRISVTDRCNLRCQYCMPEEGVTSIGHNKILTFEEIELLCRCVSRLGIRKIKLTGGEPLVRKGFARLVGTIKALPNIEEVTLTTNGILLEDYLDELKEAGLDRINISLDTLNRDKYLHITRGGDLDRVLRAIKKACMMGFQSIKINSLIMKGWNEDEIVSLAGIAKEYPVSVRFIEMMPIGNGSKFYPVYQEEILKRLEDAYGELHKCSEKMGNGPASYYEMDGFLGKIGFISAVSHEFCNDCNRIRLTADGNLKLCLQYKNLLNVKELIERGTDEEQLTEIIRMAIFLKPRKHDFRGLSLEDLEDKETKNMAQIGG